MGHWFNRCQAKIFKPGLLLANLSLANGQETCVTMPQVWACQGGEMMNYFISISLFISPSSKASPRLQLHALLMS